MVQSMLCFLFSYLFASFSFLFFNVHIINVFFLALIQLIRPPVALSPYNILTCHVYTDYNQCILKPPKILTR